MLVKELIEILQKLPQDYLVVKSKDAEGNDFSPLDEATVEMYIPSSTWSGEISNEEEHAEYHDEPYVANAVVLWPVN